MSGKSGRWTGYPPFPLTRCKVRITNTPNILFSVEEDIFAMNLSAANHVAYRIFPCFYSLMTVVLMTEVCARMLCALKEPREPQMSCFVGD